MKHFNLGTPKNLPQTSPLFPIHQNYSPFISPYNFPMQMVNSPQYDRREQDDQQFGNFKLEKQEESKKQEKQIKIEAQMYEQQSQSQQVVIENESTNKINKIIEILVKHVEKSEQKLIDQKRKYIGEDQDDLRQVYQILLKKFKKLKKTKQEMTKYCMRKAFKFLSEKIKKQNNHIKDSDAGLKYYFSHYQNDQTFTIPFKKNSLQKTMNTNFLKKVFSSQLFLTDYVEFLKYFRKLVQEDNSKKIKYLAEIIETHLNQKTIKKLENIKRLPWTQYILDRTQELAQKLTQHSPFIYQSSQNPKPIKQEQITLMKEQKVDNLKRNIILLTPLMQPLSPPHIKQQYITKKRKSE